jgi:putative transposase
VRFEFIARHRGIWQTRQMCQSLGVSRGGFYEWLTRPESCRSRENRQLLVQIRASFEQSDRTYGSPRVWRDLRAWGFSCSKRRVERLMRAAGLKARSKRRRLPIDEGARPEHAIAANVLDRQFEATAPNQRWVADFTYIWTDEGWLYFAVVMDLFSRRIVGWSMSSEMTAQLVTDALVMALWRRGKPRELLHHSDQGSQYTSEQFQRLLAEQGVTCSMSRQGDVWDNAAMESFFSSLKTERVSGKLYSTRNQARADVFDYVERFYNARRRHSTIGFVSPVEYENAAE